VGSVSSFIASGANTYSWFNLGGSLLDSDSAFTIINNTSGTFNFQLIGNAINSCPDSISISLLVNPNPLINNGNTISASCGENNGSVTGINGVGPFNYTWTNSSGQIVGNSSNINNVPSGVYQLNVIDSITGCSTNYSYTINNISNISANFSANDTVFTLGDSPVVVNFIDNSVNVITYNWSFGNGSVSILQDPNTQYNDPGLYEVILEVKGSGNCIDYDTLFIRILDSAYTWFPNIFTPNGDNVNDVFFIRSTEIKDLEVKIFNRWGLSIYEYRGIGGIWDGRTQAGEEVPDGVYYFILNGTYKNGKTIEEENRSGHIRLIRNFK
jgi:gliding motility-associated-like protein